MRRSILVYLALTGLLGAATAQAATVFGLVNTGELYVSADQGLSWTIRSALPVRDAVALGAGASVSQLYLASASGVVYRSVDAGANWAAVGAVSASDVVDLVVKPDLSVVLLTATGTVYRSVNGGASFAATGALTGSNYVSLGMSGSGAALYALSTSGEVSKSNDNGVSWATRGAITASDAIRLRMVLGKLYALTASGDVYTSSDSAATWTARGTLSQVGLTSLTNDKGTLIAGAGTGEVATSTDGAAWTWRGAINQLTVRGLGVDTPATTGAGPPDEQLGFSASPPSPNPAARGRAVTFAFRLPEASDVSLQLFDVAGRKVAERAAERFPAGEHSLNWDPAVGATGLYFVRMNAGAGWSAGLRLLILS